MTESPTTSALDITGAESLVRTLLANGVDTCFGNPGTTRAAVLDSRSSLNTAKN